jgi:hypothetical protein
MSRSRSLPNQIALLVIALASTSAGQTSLPQGGTLIILGNLPDVLAASLQVMGGRLMSADEAQVTLTGTTTDSNGSRAAQIVVQAPGYLSYREGQNRAVTFDGTSFQNKSGPLTSDDEPIAESLLAHLPDAVLLQVAAGGGVRHIGGHFRTDDGTTVNYAGPYWTLLGFFPVQRKGFTWGQPLQQLMFIAVDEQTSFISEVRLAVEAGPNQQKVTQTQFTNWTQSNGQWFPGNIVRLENGTQTLSFQVQQASVGAASATSVFQP